MKHVRFIFLLFSAAILMNACSNKSGSADKPAVDTTSKHEEPKAPDPMTDSTSKEVSYTVTEDAFKK